jgi:hypothetical protein
MGGSKVDDRAKTKITGGILAALAMLWAALSHFNEITSNIELVSKAGSAAYPLVRDWGWVPLLLVSVSILLFGLPTTWPKLWMSRKIETLSLKELVDYVTRDSEWLRAHPRLDGTWIHAARLAVQDQLSLGKLIAYGRRTTGSEHLSRPLERIPADFWVEGHFSVITDGDDPKFWNLAHGSTTKFKDVRVSAQGVKKIWRPLGEAERLKLAAAWNEENEAGQAASLVSEHLEWNDRQKNRI